MVSLGGTSGAAAAPARTATSPEAACAIVADRRSGLPTADHRSRRRRIIDSGDGAGQTLSGYTSGWRRRCTAERIAAAFLALALAACGPRDGAVEHAVAPDGATAARSSAATAEPTPVAPDPAVLLTADAAYEATAVASTPPSATTATAVLTAAVTTGGAPVQASALDASSVLLSGVSHTWQKWNNCGPSAVVMAMSPLGVDVDQLVAAASIKPDREDTNVAPDELAAYVAQHGLRARVRYGAERGRLRALLRAGVPVIVEHWVSVEGRGEMGHYRVLVGYDDGPAEFIAVDSYYGANRRYGYDAVDAMGRPFLGAYVAVFRPEQAAAVDDALAGDAVDGVMWARVGADVESYAAANVADPWAHFALGEWRARQGMAEGAVAAFDEARAIGLPFRAFWYQFGYARALFDRGAYDALVAQADATIETMKGENLEEWHVWRGRALAALGRTGEARAAFERAIAFHPGFAPAAAELERLP
ncbi:MAG: C39 family peptidase [Ardenticatenales bacterium]|nr:C39 family peptidase [Ardenticatenales bacterium]